MDIKGITHINFTVSNFETSLPFYKKFFAFIGLREMIVNDGYYYCVGRRIGLGIQQASDEYKNTPFDQDRSGLHHYCLSMESRSDVDALAEFVTSAGATIIRAPASQDHWFPGMYSVLFEDPEGLRIEANHITPKPKN